MIMTPKKNCRRKVFVIIFKFSIYLFIAQAWVSHHFIVTGTWCPMMSSGTPDHCDDDNDNDDCDDDIDGDGQGAISNM